MSFIFGTENGALFNEKIALFICTVLRKEKYRYCYGRKWTLEQMNDTIIKLPSINGKPDWKWINDYVDGLHSKPISTTKRKSDKISLDTASWKEFYLYRIFIAGMGNGIDAVMTTNDDQSTTTFLAIVMVMVLWALRTRLMAKFHFPQERCLWH